MHDTAPAEIDRASRAIAERLDLKLGSYLTDGTLLALLLDALVKRGLSPRIEYIRNPHGDRWMCVITGNSERQPYPSYGADLTRAVVSAAVDALGLQSWR